MKHVTRNDRTVEKNDHRFSQKHIGTENIVQQNKKTLPRKTKKHSGKKNSRS